MILRLHIALLLAVEYWALVNDVVDVVQVLLFAVDALLQAVLLLLHPVIFVKHLVVLLHWVRLGLAQNLVLLLDHSIDVRKQVLRIYIVQLHVVLLHLASFFNHLAVQHH